MLAIPALALVLATTAQMALPRQRIYAAEPRNSEPDVKLRCVDTEVVEGDDFRLEVRRYGPWSFANPIICVFWYTDPITADETNYEAMDRVRQASNGHQTDTGVMGRTFHTKADRWPELDETYRVRFNNSNDNGDDGECVSTIKDDNYEGFTSWRSPLTPGTAGTQRATS